MRESLGTLLVQNGVATDRDVKDAMEEGQQTGEPLGEVLVRKGVASEKQVGKLLAEQWQLQYVELDELEIDDVAALRISRDEAARLGATPIAYDGDTIVFAIVAPHAELFSEIARRIGDAAYVVVSRTSFETLIGGPLLAHAAPEESGGLWTTDEAVPELEEKDEQEPSWDSDDDEEEAYTIRTLPGVSTETAFATIDNAIAESSRLRDLGQLLDEGLPQVRELLTGQQADLAAREEKASRNREKIRELKSKNGQLETKNDELESKKDELEAKIRELESELSRQSNLFEALRGQAVALAATFDEASV